MSGWMKYPYKQCPEIDCDYFDWDNSDEVVNRPIEQCDLREDCPIRSQSEPCEACDREGYLGEGYEDCDVCNGTGRVAKGEREYG